MEIAVLADLNVGTGGGKWALERRVEETNALDPDIVLIPGDIVDADAYLT